MGLFVFCVFNCCSQEYKKAIIISYRNCPPVLHVKRRLTKRIHFWFSVHIKYSLSLIAVKKNFQWKHWLRNVRLISATLPAWFSSQPNQLEDYNSPCPISRSSSGLSNWHGCSLAHTDQLFKHVGLGPPWFTSDHAGLHWRNVTGALTLPNGY